MSLAEVDIKFNEPGADFRGSNFARQVKGLPAPNKVCIVTQKPTHLPTNKNQRELKDEGPTFQGFCWALSPTLVGLKHPPKASLLLPR